MNYVRCLLMSKNDDFIQHSSSHQRVLPCRYLKRDLLGHATQVRRRLANEYFEYNIVFRISPLQIVIVVDEQKTAVIFIALLVV